MMTKLVLSLAILFFSFAPADASTLAQKVFDICTHKGLEREDALSTLSEMGFELVTVEGIPPGPNTSRHELLAWAVPAFISNVGFGFSNNDKLAREWVEYHMAPGYVSPALRGDLLATGEALLAIEVDSWPDNDNISCFYIGPAETGDDEIMSGLRLPYSTSFFLPRVVIMRFEVAAPPLETAFVGQAFGRRLSRVFGADYPDLTVVWTRARFEKGASE